jgi:hypothetical protein
MLAKKLSNMHQRRSLAAAAAVVHVWWWICAPQRASTQNIMTACLQVFTF